MYMQIVKTDKGKVSGVTLGEPGREMTIFRGIPFASPPVGDLRWKPPQPAEPWEGVRECNQFSAISPQFEMPGMVSGFPMSEDCLYLNIVTPASQPDEKLPVMVWMHGGGYNNGSGNDEIWNNTRLPKHGVVLVTLNHRLGPIGLLAHPALSKESPEHASGNYQFLDLIASLEWIQRNIAAFGGDPDNVTIFGESGGGAKVSIMMASPLAKGLFHRAICESGIAAAFFPGKPLAEMEKKGEALFEKLGISPRGDVLEQVRSIASEKIIQVSQSMETPRKPGKDPQPFWDSTVDSWVLPQIPMDLIKSGSFNAVPLITVANLGELTGPGSLVIPWLVPAYIEMLEAVSKQGRNGYACIFDHVPAGWKKEGCVAYHSVELPYVFGDWDNSTGWWKSTYTMVQQDGIKNENPGLDMTDKKVAETVMGLWTEFARTGKPQAPGVPDWPPYTSTNDAYLYVSETPEVKTGYSKLPDQNQN
jgi:para-nitrobenzyl esterase